MDFDGTPVVGVSPALDEPRRFHLDRLLRQDFFSRLPEGGIGQKKLRTGKAHYLLHCRIKTGWGRHANILNGPLEAA